MSDTTTLIVVAPGVVLTYLGDALWVIALTIMFGASRQAWGRTHGLTSVRLPIGEAPRMLAIWALPGAAFAFSLWLALQARDRTEGLDIEIIVFGVRAVAAPLLALLHLRWLKAALNGR